VHISFNADLVKLKFRCSFQNLLFFTLTKRLPFTSFPSTRWCTTLLRFQPQTLVFQCSNYMVPPQQPCLLNSYDHSCRREGSEGAFHSYFSFSFFIVVAYHWFVSNMFLLSKTNLIKCINIYKNINTISVVVIACKFLCI